MMHVHAWRPAVPTALITALALVPVLALSAAPAFAQEDPMVHHMTVSYADLDLTTAKGRTVLERRLRHGASEVCNYDPSERMLQGLSEERACYKVAMAHAQVSLAAAISKNRVASSQ